jgi:hypothetical protein
MSHFFLRAERTEDHRLAKYRDMPGSSMETKQATGDAPVEPDVGGGAADKQQRCGAGVVPAGKGARKKERAKCPHKRQRSQCKECGGAAICPHQRERGRCKECGGSQICPHHRIRSRCKECGGSQICPHNRVRSQCKQCGGAAICPHQRERGRCKECRGGGKRPKEAQAPVVEAEEGGGVAKKQRVKLQATLPPHLSSHV